MTSHLDPDRLALLALGESADDAEAREHLAGCDVCGVELAELRAVVTTARAVPEPVELAEPPADVWHRIVDELGLNGEAAETASPEAPAAPAASTEPGPGPVPAMRPESSVPDAGEHSPARAKAHSRWFRPATLAAAAGLAGILIGAFGALALDSRDDEREPEILASAELGALPGKNGRADVAVQRTAEGLTVRVRTNGLPAADGFYEVWLLDDSAKRLISLGALPGTGAVSLPVPPGTDLSRYPILDISLEPNDGDPAHSTNSFIRGSLPT